MKTLLWFTGAFAILVGLLRLVALRWWQVPTDDAELAASIAPTLHGGDWVILWRMTPPAFGDLVVCPDPNNEGYSVIGRIAAEGGDSVKLGGSDVYINKRKLATESSCPTEKIEDPSTGASVELYCTTEAMGSSTHMRLNTTKNPQFSSEIQEGNVFLLSDNRDMPFDSRHYGTIEQGLCKETVVFRLVGPDGFGGVKDRFTFIR